VQINLCAPQEEILRRLSLPPKPARSREIWYFESPSLEQFARGTVFRLRLGKNERVLTLKASPADCVHLDRALLPQGQGKCEYDVHGDSTKGAVSLDANLDEATVRGLLDKRIALGDALSPAQVRYLKTSAGGWPLAADLRPLGPVRVDTYKPRRRRFDVDLWRLPGEGRYAEISQKGPADAASRLDADIKKDLAGAGLEPCADQSSQAESKLRALLAAP